MSTLSIFHGAEVGVEALHPEDIFSPFGSAGGWQAFIKRGALGDPDFYYGWGQGLTEADAVAAAAANYKQQFLASIRQEPKPYDAKSHEGFYP